MFDSGDAVAMLPLHQVQVSEVYNRKSVCLDTVYDCLYHTLYVNLVSYDIGESL